MPAPTPRDELSERDRSMRTVARKKKLVRARSKLTKVGRTRLLRAKYRSALTSRAAGQSAGYLASRIVVLITGGITGAILARSLTVAEFGSYAAATSLLVFVALFFEFGLFLPAARAAAMGSPEEGRKVLGAALVAFVPVAIAYLVVIYVLSFFVDSWFNVQVSSAIRVVAPLTVAFPLQFLAYQMAQGMDRLHVFSLTSAVGAVLFAGLLAAGFTLGVKFSVVGMLAVSFMIMLLSLVWLLARLRPQLGSGVRGRVTVMVRDARSYGFEVYVGRVLAIGTYRIDLLMVAALTDARSVAFYSLAGAIATVVAFPGVALGAALFPRMTKLHRIPRQWLLITSLAGVAGSIAAAALGRPLITAVFSARYLPAADLLIPLALAEGLRSVTALYTAFQSAHGRGKDLRKAATFLTVSNLIFNFGLIPTFGAAGAAWASFLALLVNLMAHMTYYRRSLSVPEGPDADDARSADRAASLGLPMALREDV